MTEFDLNKEFELVIIPARSFNHVLTSEEQARTFDSVFSHLRPQGRLILDIFGASREHPREDISSTEMSPTLEKGREFLNPVTGNRVLSFGGLSARDVEKQTESYAQVFEEVDEDGKSLEEFRAGFRIRYTFPDEMEKLLVECGFEIESTFSDYPGRPRGERSDGDQIWIAVKP